MKKLCIGFLTVMVSNMVWGLGLPELRKNTVGNGGDVLNCSSDSSVTMLDLYEGQSRYRFTYEAVVAATPQEHLYQQLDRWQRVDPYLVNSLKAQVATFQSETIFLDDVSLEDINDSGYIAIPDSCSVEQVAIQRVPIFPQDPWFTVDNDLWQQMDILNQAALILHEIIYRQAVAQLKTNSISSRYLTALLLSTEYIDFSVMDYLEVLYAARHLFAERVTLEDRDLQIYNAAAFHSGEKELMGFPANPLTVTADSGSEVVLPITGVASIDVNNKVTAAYFDPPEIMDVWGEELKVDSLKFNPDQGFLVEADLAEHESFSQQVSRRCAIELFGDGYLRFDPSGRLERIVAPTQGAQVCIASIVYSSGQETVIPTRVLEGWFHPNGLLKRGFFEQEETMRMEREQDLSFIGIFVDFYDTGFPEYVAVHSGQSLFRGLYPDGSLVLCRHDIRFDRQRYVESCYL